MIGQSALIFAREPLSDALLDEALPLLDAHWREVGHYTDIPLQIERDFYLRAEASGTLRMFTTRLAGQLVGYGAYYVRANPHYADSLQAHEDVIYIEPGSRGIGWRFIAWMDEQLTAEGVEVVYRHVKLAHDYSRVLARMGYEAIDQIWGKRLNGRLLGDDRDRPLLDDRAEPDQAESEGRSAPSAA